MTNARPRRTPLPLSYSLYEGSEPSNDDKKRVMRDKPYEEILGALLYLSTRTRPEISAEVSVLGKFQADKRKVQWKHLQNFVWYIIHTPEQGNVLNFNYAPTMWSSMFQPSTDHSTSKAEFFEIESCVQEVDWVRSLIKRD